MPSLSDQALQMEGLIRALIPFKINEVTKWQETKLNELRHLEEWYDNHINALKEELTILREHAAALGIEPKTPDPDHEKRKQDLQDAYIAGTMTASELTAAQKLLGVPYEAPGINDDPMAAARIVRDLEMKGEF